MSIHHPSTIRWRDSISGFGNSEFEDRRPCLPATCTCAVAAFGCVCLCVCPCASLPVPVSGRLSLADWQAISGAALRSIQPAHARLGAGNQKQDPLASYIRTLYWRRPACCSHRPPPMTSVPLLLLHTGCVAEVFTFTHPSVGRRGGIGVAAAAPKHILALCHLLSPPAN